MNHPAHQPLTSSQGRGDTSIGGLLLEAGKITPESAERVLRMQKELGIRFGEAAQRLGLITEADIQQVLARQFDYPYLQPGEAKYPDALVAAYQPFSHQVEILRAVRSQLMLRWFARSRRGLAVVGLNSGDGVSMFTANLGVVFSQLGERTLLVDANLRRPHQGAVFDLKAPQGLSDMLAGRAQADVIQKVPSFVDLSVLTAGTIPPNPQELLSRNSFAELHGRLESQYDVVLYDVAAYSLGADAIEIARRVGGVLVVVRKNQTSQPELQSMVEQLKRSGAEVVGTVLIDY